MPGLVFKTSCGPFRATLQVVQAVPQPAPALLGDPVTNSGRDAGGCYRHHEKKETTSPFSMTTSTASFSYLRTLYLTGYTLCSLLVRHWYIRSFRTFDAPAH